MKFITLNPEDFRRKSGDTRKTMYRRMINRTLYQRREWDVIKKNSDRPERYADDVTCFWPSPSIIWCRRSKVGAGVRSWRSTKTTPRPYVSNAITSPIKNNAITADIGWPWMKKENPIAPPVGKKVGKSDVLFKAEAAAHWYLSDSPFEPIRLSCEQFLRTIADQPALDRVALDAAWEWAMGLPQPKGKGGATIEIGWQMMLFVLVIGPIFGLKGNRQTLVCIPRKCGKTSFAAQLALTVMRHTPDKSARVYSLATKRQQARLVFEDGRAMAYTKPLTEEEKEEGLKAWDEADRQHGRTDTGTKRLETGLSGF